jgi:hypothetical protein
VKFRHISVEESRSLKPKTSGPWSRKHSACGQQLHHGRYVDGRGSIPCIGRARLELQKLLGMQQHGPEGGCTAACG